MSLLVLTCGCSTPKAYYSENSAPANERPVEDKPPRQLPAVERTESTTEKKPQPAPVAAITPNALGRDRERAAAEAIVQSNRAAAASAIALKASAEAAKAAAEASRAAARASGVVSPSAPPTPAQLTLSSTGEADRAHERQRVAGMIKGINRALQTIDRQRQTADGLNRTALAEKFLQSAQKAFADGSYAEAGSLASKASMMIAPLTTTPGPLSP